MAKEVAAPSTPASIEALKRLRLRQCTAYGSFASELNDDQKVAVSVPRQLFQGLLTAALEAVPVDEDWYKEKYPDFYAQLLRGHFESAKDHYMRFGFFEDRMPHPITVDPDFYVTEYPDTQKLAGDLVAIQDHFESYGFKEGRLPYPGWSLI
jgi:hypothetical protein